MSSKKEAEKSGVFASEVKEELLACVGKTRDEMASELLAMYEFSGGEPLKKRCVTCRDENSTLARKDFTLLKKAFNINSVLSLYKDRRTGKGGYEVRISNQEDADRFFNALSELSLDDVESARAYIRGAYIFAGTVTDPEKGYRLEIICKDADTANKLEHCLSVIGISPKRTVRKGKIVVYIQDAEQLATTLGMIGAGKAYLGFESTRVLREVRGKINRKVNCETSNLQKTVDAARRQIRDIEYLRENNSFFALPNQLREIAELRTKYPNASYGELGEMASPPVGRSGVNHRLRAISKIADELRKDKLEEGK